MSGRTVVAALSVWALVLPSLVCAGALEFQVSIVDGPLSSGLKALESQTGIELLYDGDVVRELQAPSVVGKLNAEAALQQLLSESELTVRRSASGAWIIERRTTPALAQQDAAVAEILVVGRRTQNADIRRTEEDVQPYMVATGEEIRRAHRDNVDQFLSSRLTSSTTAVPSLASQEAGVMSSVDLRGLGDANTVVLVDGRRMPSIPNVERGFRQSDLNAIPLHAIERIEVLTGAAGGIHGFGALGGVVNIVLDRDIDGLEFHSTQGLTSRGDARLHDVEAKFGQTFGDGATDFVMFASHQELETPRVEDRNFAIRDYERTNQLAPEYLAYFYPHGNSLKVQGFFAGTELTFKPEFGGGALGSDHTYLPLGFAGDATALTSALEQHAGEVDLSLPANRAQWDLGSNPQSDALLANLRHRFGSGWEAYADVVMLRNRGESVGPVFVFPSGGKLQPALSSGFTFMAPESPANPFTDYITVDYPFQNLNGLSKRRIDNSRYTTGLEAALPFDWRGILEAGWGRLRYLTSASDAWAPLGNFVLFGDESDLETNPLGDWATFDRVVQRDVLRDTLKEVAENRFHTESLRLAGPVFSTRAGPTSLTLLVEHRSERVPPTKETLIYEINGTPYTDERRDDPLARRVRSYYGELRSRLFDESARLPMVRGMEVQLAVRRDEQDDDFQRTLVFPDDGALHSRFAGTAYTFGVKSSPARWLMLRGSYATGEQPPPIYNLVEMDPFTYGPDDLLGPDTKRGDTLIGAEGDVLVPVGGSSKLKAARATTLFFGAVFTPGGVDGPRFSLDYSRIRRTRDIQSHVYFDILAHEDEWPERVRRAALTDADRALGYTGGRIEMIDSRDANDASMEMHAFDLRTEWPLAFLDGRLRLYANATYHKSNMRTNGFEPGVEWAGYLDGPLQRRANGGFDWSKDRLTIGANAQYFGSSLIYGRGEILSLLIADSLQVQGSARIPSQTYLDLSASWRLPVHGLDLLDSFTLDLGVINVLDKSPPRESTFITFGGPAYSRYGDFRMRRFELGVSCRF